MHIQEIERISAATRRAYRRDLWALRLAICLPIGVLLVGIWLVTR